MSAHSQTAAAKFEVGRTYWARSLCDHDSIFRFTVIGRTATTVTVRADTGKTARRSLRIWGSAESVRPFGSYSMAPVLTADQAE